MIICDTYGIPDVFASSYILMPEVEVHMYNHPLTDLRRHEIENERETILPHITRTPSEIRASGAQRFIPLRMTQGSPLVHLAPVVSRGVPRRQIRFNTSMGIGYIDPSTSGEAGKE